MSFIISIDPTNTNLSYLIMNILNIFVKYFYLNISISSRKERKFFMPAYLFALAILKFQFVWFFSETASIFHLPKNFLFFLSSFTWERNCILSIKKKKKQPKYILEINKCAECSVHCDALVKRKIKYGKKETNESKTTHNSNDVPFFFF